MTDEIVNRIAKSKLVTIDLEELFPKGERLVFDISKWLYEGLILKEKDFRDSIKQQTWQNYKDNYIAISCSTDAIIPSWAYLLVSSNLTPYAKTVVVGDLNLLETVIFTKIIDNLDISFYKNKSVIIKGCANKPIPNTAYTALVQKLQPVVKSIMYGEACSTVPIYKNKKA